MSERKDTDLQIQLGGGVYYFWIIMLYSQIFKQLLATQNQQVQTGRDWYNCIPSLAQSYSCSLPAALSEHLKGKEKKKKKKKRQIVAWWCCDREMIQTMPPKQSFPKDSKRKHSLAVCINPCIREGKRGGKCSASFPVSLHQTACPQPALNSEQTYMNNAKYCEETSKP